MLCFLSKMMRPPMVLGMLIIKQGVEHIPKSDMEREELQKLFFLFPDSCVFPIQILTATYGQWIPIKLFFIFIHTNDFDNIIFLQYNAIQFICSFAVKMNYSSIGDRLLQIIKYNVYVVKVAAYGRKLSVHHIIVQVLFIKFKVVTMPPVAAQMMMKAVDFLLLVPYPSDLLYPYSGDTSTLQSTL